jgi:hypothetical protein
MNLPSQLHHTRPVVEVSQGRILIKRETGGLCVEYQKHKKLLIE